MGDLIALLGQLIRLLIQILELLIIIQVILSWTGIRLPLNRLTHHIYALTDAIYRPVRNIIPTVAGSLDFTPLVVLLGLYLIDRWLVSAIIKFGYRLTG
jgi:YggT family protein